MITELTTKEQEYLNNFKSYLQSSNVSKPRAHRIVELIQTILKKKKFYWFANVDEIEHWYPVVQSMLSLKTQQESLEMFYKFWKHCHNKKPYSHKKKEVEDVKQLISLLQSSYENGTLSKLLQQVKKSES